MILYGCICMTYALNWLLYQIKCLNVCYRLAIGLWFLRPLPDDSEWVVVLERLEIEQEKVERRLDETQEALTQAHHRLGMAQQRLDEDKEKVVELVSTTQASLQDIHGVVRRSQLQIYDLRRAVMNNEQATNGIIGDLHGVEEMVRASQLVAIDGLRNTLAGYIDLLAEQNVAVSD